MKNNKFIQISAPDTTCSFSAFKELMETTEEILNLENIGIHEKPKPSEVEDITVAGLKKATGKVCCFKPTDIKLVSGVQFPDIKIQRSYGVEVKSSQSGWTSIGSSIIESTRIPDIEEIYMVFANLHSKPALFKCRPYQDVLTDIKVTHSPRYEINMETNRSIFDILGVPYNQFRLKEDKAKIELAQIYARKKLLEMGRKEMPWWIKDLKDNSSQGNIKLWNELSGEEKKRLAVQCMILFPSVVNPKQSPTKYNDATLWLCSYYQIVSPNIRDIFSAGGQEPFIYENIKYMMPRVYCKVRDNLGEIRNMIEFPDEDMAVQMDIYNPSLIRRSSSDRFLFWLNQISCESKKLPLIEFLEI